MAIATRSPGCRRPTVLISSKLPRCAPRRNAPLAAREQLAHELLALDRHVEQLVALLHQVEPVEDGGGEGKHLA